MKAGRKTSYDSKYAKMIDELAVNPESLIVRGVISDTKIARLIGVSPETVRKWKKPVPGRENEYQAEFAVAIKKCQSAIDADEVKRSMVAKAKGFVSRKVTRYYNPATKKMEINKEIKEVVAGDVAAAKLVLNNIDKSEERWNTADKQELDGNLKIDGLSKVLSEIDGNGKRLPRNGG